MKIFAFVILFSSISFADCTLPDGGIFALINTDGRVIKMVPHEGFEITSAYLKDKEDQTYTVFSTERGSVVTQIFFKDGKAQKATSIMKDVDSDKKAIREVEYEWNGTDCNIKTDHYSMNGNKGLVYDRDLCKKMAAKAGDGFKKATMNQCVDIWNKIRPVLEEATEKAVGTQSEIAAMDHDHRRGTTLRVLDLKGMADGILFANDCADALDEEKAHPGGFSNMATRGAIFKKMFGVHDHEHDPKDDKDKKDDKKLPEPAAATS